MIELHVSLYCHCSPQKIQNVHVHIANVVSVSQIATNSRFLITCHECYKSYMYISIAQSCSKPVMHHGLCVLEESVGEARQVVYKLIYR